jgi:uncharacterized protein YodC (DUF2158 family)
MNKNTTANPFKVGDIVWLNSGSPSMTVVETADALCYVAWVNDAGDKVHDEFAAACLRNSDPSRVMRRAA